MAKNANDIGIKVGNLPGHSCSDKNCPFHGSIKLRGRIFTGKVLAGRAQKTATVGWERMYYIPKFERYEKRRTKLHVHNPECINAGENDIVKIAETRPLSKTKHFVIIEKLGKEVKVIAADLGAEQKAEKGAEKKKEKTAKKDKNKENADEE